MTTPIPPIKARNSTEIKDSCNCSSTCCWPRRKHSHIKKASGSVDVRVDEVAQRTEVKK